MWNTKQESTVSETPKKKKKEKKWKEKKINYEYAQGTHQWNVR